MIGCMFGVWDTLHIGHIRVIKQAAKACGKLVVGVFNDEETCKRKKRPTLVPEKHRLECVLALGCVDDAYIYKDPVDPTPRPDADIWFCGPDQPIELISNLKASGKPVVILSRTENISTTLERTNRLPTFLVSMENVRKNPKLYIQFMRGTASPPSVILWDAENTEPDLTSLGIRRGLHYGNFVFGGKICDVVSAYDIDIVISNKSVPDCPVVVWNEN